MTNITRKGFTLIELLIVMAILGVLAVVVLVAINPVQQLARTRDSGRKSGVTQIGHALEAYYTARGGSYVTEGATWITELVTAGELSTVPSLIKYSAPAGIGCTNAAQNSWCYQYDAVNGLSIAYSRLESDSEESKCDTVGDLPFFVWSTFFGRGGLHCVTSGEPDTPSFDELTDTPWNNVQ